MKLKKVQKKSIFRVKGNFFFCGAVFFFKSKQGGKKDGRKQKTWFCRVGGDRCECHDRRGDLQPAAEHVSSCIGGGGDHCVGDHGDRDLFSGEHVPDPFGCVSGCHYGDLCLRPDRVREVCGLSDGVGVLALQHLRQCGVCSSAHGCAQLLFPGRVHRREQPVVHSWRILCDLADELGGAAWREAGGVPEYCGYDLQTGADLPLYPCDAVLLPLGLLHAGFLGRKHPETGGSHDAGEVHHAGHAVGIHRY